MNSSVCVVNNSIVPATTHGKFPPAPKPLRVGELQIRIASTLGLAPKAVKLEGQRTRGLMQQCWGAVGGRRFFAKIYLANRYSVPAPFATPWEEVETPNPQERTVEEQVTLELTKFQRMLCLMGPRNVPALLACSLINRTLVYEKIDGRGIDSLASHRFFNLCRPHGCTMRSVETALAHAGAWLRALHNSSAQGFEMVEPDEVVDGLRALLQKRQMEGSAHADLARHMFEPLGSELRAAVRVPVALNHGDFTLPNLLWNRDRQHLWVVDFELSSCRPIIHDLCTLLAAFRRELLMPLTSPRVVRTLEEAFWRGYGRISEAIRTLVECLACAAPFYRELPQPAPLKDRLGWRARFRACQNLLQNLMVKRLVRAKEYAATGLKVRSTSVLPQRTKVESHR